MILLFLNCLPNRLINEEPYPKAQFMTHKCFLNGLRHHLRDTKTSESSGSSRFVEQYTVFQKGINTPQE